MLRFLVLAFTALCASVYCEDSSPTPASTAKPKESLAARLKREETGELDDDSKAPVRQIEEAHGRYIELYLEARGKDEEKAVKDAFNKVYDRILKRAEEKVREAKENLEFSKRPRESKGERT